MSEDKAATRSAAARKAWNTRKGIDEHKNKVRTPHFPLYSTVRKLLAILQGVPKATLTSMMRIIDEQTGTPQNPVDWSKPDIWIDERLSGDEAGLARRIWVETERTVNPRHIHGTYFFIRHYELLAPDADGIYQFSERGWAFLEDDAKVVRELDEAEGLPQLLSIIATKTQTKRADMLSEWGEFLLEHSQCSTLATFQSTLRYRLLNLVERGMVMRDGNTYVITPQGIAYSSNVTRVKHDPKREVLSAINEYNNEQREALRDQLRVMHPYKFEHLVRELLEEMGYGDVTVTKQSGDKGVDVVATVQFGITTFIEVVQVKRHQPTIHRPIIDQLRGALHYYKALRGTIITLGNFSKGCTEAALLPGAPPIGLINGEKLLDLLVKHQVRMRKREVTLYEVDEDFFKPGDEEAELEGTEAIDAGEEI
jgi:restriction system protein